VTVIIITVTWIGGLPFFIVFLLLAVLYFEVARVYGQTARDMRRLGMSVTVSLHAELTPVADSVARSPLYSIYGETIVGVPVLRAFGASSKFMRDMLRCVDTVSRYIPICDHPLTHSQNNSCVFSSLLT
jgi:ABC-type multidrug transport system fused ATPase/permease subunit